MAFLGDIERFFAELYPYRWPILILVFLALTAVAGLGIWRGWNRALWRHRVGMAKIGTPGLAAVVAIIIWLGLPLFTSTTVDEEFPFAAQAMVPEGMTKTGVEQIMEGMAKVDQPMNEPMPKVMSGGNGEKESTAGTDPAQEGPLILKSGSFRGADSFHKGSGRATIYRSPDGSHLLRLEDFQSTNGPDLHVVLSPSPNPQSSEQVKSAGYVDLGKLKGNVGNQNYPIPEGTNLDVQMSVVIYCKPFQVVFSVAALGEG